MSLIEVYRLRSSQSPTYWKDPAVSDIPRLKRRSLYPPHTCPRANGTRVGRKRHQVVVKNAGGLSLACAGRAGGKFFLKSQL